YELLEIQLPAEDYASIPSPEEEISEAVGLDIETQEQKIIKNATLRFETSDVSQTAQSIIKNAQQYNGFVEKDNESKDYGRFTRNINIRVPNKYYDNVITESTKGITHFDEKLITAVDVTSDYSDVEARLKDKPKLTARYQQVISYICNHSDM